MYADGEVEVSESKELYEEKMSENILQIMNTSSHRFKKFCKSQEDKENHSNMHHSKTAGNHKLKEKC